MICKERSRLACLAFIFISGFFFTPSFTNTIDTATSEEMEDEGDLCNLDETTEESHAVLLKNSSQEFCCLHLSIPRECDVHHHLPSSKAFLYLLTHFLLSYCINFVLSFFKALRDFNFKNITFIMDTTYNLSCFWSVTNLPKNAVYSADVSHEESLENLNCFHILEKQVVECHSNAALEESKFTLIVNISLPTLSYRIMKMFNRDDIVKPSPPDNIRASNNGTKLEINWNISEKDRVFFDNSLCFVCQLKINDEVLDMQSRQLSYIKQDVDVTRVYTIQVRIKLSSSCGNAIYWSDWSSIHEVGPFENKYSVNPWWIAVIALVLPMLLLAILLICKCQRLPKKLFPPIPTPSVNVKNLLEKDNNFPDLSSRYVYHEVVHTIEEGKD